MEEQYWCLVDAGGIVRNIFVLNPGDPYDTPESYELLPRTGAQDMFMPYDLSLWPQPEE